MDNGNSGGLWQGNGGDGEKESDSEHDMKRKLTPLPDGLNMECERRRRVKEYKVMKLSLKHSQMLLYLITVLLMDSNWNTKTSCFKRHAFSVCINVFSCGFTQAPKSTSQFSCYKANNYHFSFFLWPHSSGCKILVPWPGIDPQQWKRSILTTGPPGNSLKLITTLQQTCKVRVIQNIQQEKKIILDNKLGAKLFGKSMHSDKEA